eukprot:7302978-Alexandrium_andersonii.AAC.1
MCIRDSRQSAIRAILCSWRARSQTAHGLQQLRTCKARRPRSLVAPPEVAMVPEGRTTEHVLLRRP